MQCQFPPLVEGKPRICQACGRSVVSGKSRLYFSCRRRPDPAPDEPSVLEKAAKYSKAVARWTLAGMPVRTPEQVSELQVICEGCEHYKQWGNAPARSI